MKLDNVKIEDVLEMMTTFQPDWMIRWADPQDLREALEMAEEKQRAFLTRAQTSKVMAVLRAAWATAKKRENELAKNSENLSRELLG